MRISWQLNIDVLLGERDEQLGEFLDAHARTAKLMSEEEFEVDQHLVIAAASGMDLLTYITQLTREHSFDMRMNVLACGVDDNAITVYLFEHIRKRSRELTSLIVGDEADSAKHFRMRNRPNDIPSCKAHINVAIASNGEGFHQCVDGGPFVPWLHCKLRSVDSRR